MFGPIRLEREDLDRNAFALEDRLQVVGDRLLAAWRIGRVHPDNRLEVPERLFLDGRPIGFGRSLRGRQRRGERETDNGGDAHAANGSALRARRG